MSGQSLAKLGFGPDWGRGHRASTAETVSLACAADGKHLLFGNWLLSTQPEKLRLILEGERAAFSADTRSVVSVRSAPHPKLLLLDAATGARRDAIALRARPTALALARDRVAVGLDDATVAVFALH